MTTNQLITKATGRTQLEVARALQRLSQIERDIMETRFCPTTLVETASRHGITPLKVYEIESRFYQLLND